MAGGISGQRQEFGGALYPQIASRRRDGPARDELEEGQAAQGFRGFRDRASAARQRPLLCAEEPHHVPGGRRRGQSGAAVDHVLAHPEIPLGAFPAQRQPGRRVRVPRHAHVHERRRHAESGRSAGSRHRASARHLSRPAQRHLHPRLRVVAGVRGSLRKVRADQQAGRGEGRRRPEIQADTSQRGRGPGLDGLRGARGHSRHARPGHQGQGRGPRRRL